MQMLVVGALDGGACGNPTKGRGSLDKLAQCCIVFTEKLIPP